MSHAKSQSFCDKICPSVLLSKNSVSFRVFCVPINLRAPLRLCVRKKYVLMSKFMVHGERRQTQNLVTDVFWIEEHIIDFSESKVARGEGLVLGVLK